jgi:hypothetical protein
MTPLSRLLAFALVFALPMVASAQVTAHKLKISIKGLGQTTNDANDLKPDPFGANVKDLFEVCTGNPAAKDEGIYLFIDCANLNNNQIAAIDTDPLALIEDLGSINFALGDAVQKTKNQDLKSVSVPADINIDCGQAELSAFAIIDVNFKDLEGEACPNNAKGKMIGTGSADEDFILDQGSSINANTRSGSIAGFPPEP